ncbi:MAG: VacB/RNase II family 3'-5' exoribonuclease [Chlamydiales bacterium]|nr:VacB/RNase II family 3'-5' exoribonuclease [Chlamydiales bacterium]
MTRKSKKESNIAIGTIRVHQRGFGFLIPDDRSRFPLDIFIPRRAIKGSVDQDLVEVAVNTRFVSEKGPEGRVLKILRRGRSHVAGTISYVGKKERIYAHIPLLGEERQMQVRPSEERPLKVGDRITIHVLDWGSTRRDALGEMSAYIGHISDASCDIPAAIEEFELEEAFSRRVLQEAKRYGTSVSQKEISEREDLRKLECITIDPDTAKDFDDALSLRKDNRGNYHLGVHIADVSYYVKPGTFLDKEARLRCNSIYFPGTVLPMLPHELSSHLCSLKPKVNRLAVSVLMVLDRDGELKSYRIARSVIQSKKRFTYKEAKEVLDRKKKSPYRKQLELMVELCRHLKRLRAQRGSIEFALPDTAIQVDEKGMPKRIEIVEYDITHQLVEEFMLKANEIVATHLSKEGKPLAYRVHEEPNPENIKEFAAVATALGFPLSDRPDAGELQALFDQARESSFGQFLATQFIRSMKLASYSTENVGHYGLGLEYYTHFTSPIRRYIDLIVHRLLFDESDPKENYEKIAAACSDKERHSSRAENSVVLLKKLRLLNAHRKENPKRTYEAVVTTVKPFGFAFEVSELLLDGFINERRHFKTGDKVRVKIAHTDLISQEVEWVVV